MFKFRSKVLTMFLLLAFWCPCTQEPDPVPTPDCPTNVDNPPCHG